MKLSPQTVQTFSRVCSVAAFCLSLTARAQFDARKAPSDEETNAFVEGVQHDLEAELMNAVPTTREGVVALLNIVAESKRKEAPPDKELSWMDILELRAVEHVRDAIEAGAGC